MARTEYPRQTLRDFFDEGIAIGMVCVECESFCKPYAWVDDNRALCHRCTCPEEYGQ